MKKKAAVRPFSPAHFMPVLGFDRFPEAGFSLRSRHTADSCVPDSSVNLAGNTNGVLHNSPGLPSEATLGSRPRGANSNGVVARQAADAVGSSFRRLAQALLATTRVGVGGSALI